MKRWTITVLVFLAAFARAAGVSGEENTVTDRGVRITWKAVPAVEHYVVEVKNSAGVLVARRATRRTYVYVKIEPGSYSVRITGYNKFRKRQGNSPWTSLSVRLYPPPLIEKVSSSEFSTSGVTDLEISGSNFREGTRVYLRSGGQRYEADRVDVVSPEKMVVDFGLKRAMVGQYDLVIESPGGKKAVRRDGVILMTPEAWEVRMEKLRMQRPPVVENISPSFMFMGRGDLEVTINGRDFTEGSTVTLVNGGHRLVLKKQYVSHEEVVCRVPRDRIREGAYHVDSRNSLSTTASSADLLKVRDPARGLLLLGGLDLALGYHMNYVIPGGWDNIYDFSFLGFSLNAGYGFRAFSPLSRVPVLNCMGMEYQLNAANFSNNGEVNMVSSSMLQVGNSFGIYLKHDFGLPLSFILRGRGGLMLSRLETEARGVTMDYSSADWYYEAGMAVQYIFLNFYFIEAGVDYRSVLYSEETFQSVSLFMMAGVRL